MGMSQRLLHHTFGVREGYTYRSTKYVEGRVEFHLEVKEKMLVCPQCGSKEVWRRGKRERRIKSVPIGFKDVVLVAEVPRCECRGCGKSFEVSPLCPKPWTCHPVLGALRLRTEPVDEPERCSRASTRGLGEREEHCQSRPLEALCPHRAQRRATHRH